LSVCQIMLFLLMRLQSVQVAVLRRCEGGECEGDTLARAGSAVAVTRSTSSSGAHIRLPSFNAYSSSSPCQEEIVCLALLLVASCCRHGRRLPFGQSDIYTVPSDSW
jgi:hypothetical protein